MRGILGLNRRNVKILVWIFWELGLDIDTRALYNKSIEGELTAQDRIPRVKRLSCVAYRDMRVFSLTY